MAEWQDAQAGLDARLRSTDRTERMVFVASVAERWMADHEARPADEQQPFTVGLRPLLDDVWRAACGDQTAFRGISDALGRFYLSEYSHNDGQDGPDDADDDAAAAVLYAAEHYMHGFADFAVVVSSRGVEAASFRVQMLADDGAGDEDEDNLAMLRELELQERELDLIARHGDDLRYSYLGLSVGLIARINDELRSRLVAGA
jgi:hypothetical protein